MSLVGPIDQSLVRQLSAATDAAAQVRADAPADARREQIEDVARQFEGILIQQLVSVMRGTVGGGEGGLFGQGAGSGMYEHLFDQNMADSMTSSGGIGLSQVLSRSMLGPAAYREQSSELGALSRIGMPTEAFEPRSVGAILAVRPTSGALLPGATGSLQSAADGMLPGGLAPQWGREGRLTEADLASDFHTSGPQGDAFFNVRDAAGFEGHYKCNLFAFELARRAGFSVPVSARTRGWGYMGPDSVTTDARSGSMRGGWGNVVTGETAESLDSAAVSGDRAFMLTGSSTGDRAGHMGIVERVHQVDYDASGDIERVVFDGWEGRVSGARHLVRRTWNRAGNPGGEDVRGGFSDIQIIELNRPEEGGSTEIPLHESALPSFHDDFSSRFGANRPTEYMEEGI